MLHVHHLTIQCVLAMVLWIAATAAGAIDRQQNAARCGSAEPLPRDGTTHGSWVAADHFTVARGRRFSLAAAEPGLAIVEMTTPSHEDSALLRFGCGSSADIDVVWKNGRALIVQFTRPGAFELVVDAAHGSTLPRHFRLDTSFTAEPLAAAPSLEIDTDPPNSCAEESPEWTLGTDAAEASLGRIRRHRTSKDVEPWECDVIECKVAHTKGWTFVSLRAFGPPLQVSLFRGARCEPSTRLADAILDRPDAVLRGPVPPGRWRMVVDLPGAQEADYTIEARSYALCRRDPTDDHGDTPFCATPFDGGAFSGRLEAAAGDTDDLLLLTVDTLTTVAVDVSAGLLSIETFDGRRLDRGGLCDLDGAHRVTATLSAGLYLIRVEADRPEAFDFHGTVQKRPLG